MKYQSTLIAVRDIERSRNLYCGLLGMGVTSDLGANITLSDRISLQTMETWKNFIRRGENEIMCRSNAVELYFEEEDMDAFLERLSETPDIQYVHHPLEHAWGQRVVRFYDPDGHMIEVGESMAAVVRRFRESGLSVETTARRMDVPVEYVRSFENHAEWPQGKQKGENRI